MRENELTKLIEHELPSILVNENKSSSDKFIIQENTIHYDEPIIKLVNTLLQNAIEQKASDIHFDSHETFYKVRFRQDGLLYPITEIPINLGSRVITRLKVMAKLDITERRLPQDGRLKLKNGTTEHIDLRISTCPTLHGEKVVLRILNLHSTPLNITKLGLTNNQKKIFLAKLTAPQGLIIVTGPTGSGKTLTLYSALHFLHREEKNISTVEDPVEIELAGINQMNVHAKIGLTFATALRALLRQDPDILMVGEIRDKETATVALHAAQTGHLVFSTLHTNSALEALTRLQCIEINIQPLADALSLIISQRLIRKLCHLCKKLDINHHYVAIGCSHCKQGYQGREGIFELISITPSLKDLLTQPAPKEYIYSQMKESGFTTLWESGMEKVRAGITTLEEIQRVVGNTA